MSTLAVGVVNSSYSKGIASTVTFGSPVTRHPGVVTELPAGTNLSSDPRVLAFMHGTNERAMIASYTYATPPSVGSATFGVYAPTTTGSWGSPIATATTSGGTNNWGISNPWGLVSIDKYLYIQDYDSNNIAIVDMASGYTLAGTISNVFTGYDSGKTPHGSGMDVYSFDDPDTLTTVYVLAALYNQSDSSYTYGNSGLVLIRVDGTTATTIGTIITLTKNATSVTVEADSASGNFYAYVTAMGGMQTAGGNGSASTVQAVTLPNTVSGGIYTPTLALLNTVTAMTSPSTFGDFNDIEFWDSNAYILGSNYDSSYSTYTYRLIRVAAASLRSGSFSGSSNTGALTSTPAGATWLLAPANDTLWLVDGNFVHNVPAGTLSSGSTPFGSATADATDGTSSGVGLGTSDVNGNLNTASVVIDRTATRTRSGKPATAVSRSKMALTAEELKRRTGKK
ncbi:hypothetical protein [Sporomusa acidovorans]|uniref:Uncharacterized protein n=1 Tax=Sporomusa acidovorans (strain ATCC 49682 / DSM 3132 / Mol) TaxID=1123286 RepID=A0ABZ3J602_SPOA4|nr:hypothetical protein [Sporomusa acidovorans]OZC23943.1 hypothetical protein SPACI_03610 [Sporomusa acidovorans DSM 3132]SDF31769.1 hypothetical protein SAMN04488499_104331 [Sporomusa acidovorans]